jgi:hypothetical protein
LGPGAPQWEVQVVSSTTVRLVDQVTGQVVQVLTPLLPHQAPHAARYPELWPPYSWGATTPLLLLPGSQGLLTMTNIRLTNGQIHRSIQRWDVISGELRNYLPLNDLILQQIVPSADGARGP